MPRGLTPQTLHLIAEANAVLERSQPAGVRAVCYQLFNRHDPLLPDMSKRSTNKVSRALTEARKRGLTPWDWIVDDHREIERQASWANPHDYALTVKHAYRRDRWRDQDDRVMVVSEKGTVKGTLRPVIDAYGIEVLVAHGYNSTTLVRALAQASVEARRLVLIYIGDFDPSGLDMSERDLPQRLTEYGGRDALMRRVAITAADVPRLPTFPVSDKQHDSRARWFATHYGHRCCELDALDPNDLRARVETEIRRHIDWQRWNRAETAEAAELASLSGVLTEWSRLPMVGQASQ